MKDNIQEAKQKLPLPKLMEQLRLGEHAKKRARCPWHEDKNASLSVWENERGWHWKCHAGCGAGDEISLVAIVENISNADATKRFLEMARVNGSNAPKILNGTSRTVSVKAFDWKACTKAFTDEHLSRLQEWRGYSNEFCAWLRAADLVGICKGNIAFPVHDASGAVVAAHCRPKQGNSWFYNPTGTATAPLVIGENPARARFVHVFESQWDAFEVCDKLHVHLIGGSSVLATRGAENGALVAGFIPQDAEVFAWVQNDPDSKRNRKTGKTPADKWLDDVSKHARARVRAVRTPPGHEDPNAWGKAGATASDYMAVLNAADVIAERPQPIIEFLSPSQLASFVPPSGMVLVGDCHIVRGSVFVVGGPPGVGKSRAGVSMGVAGATGLDCFGLKVHARFKTMILQNENGRFRLQREFSELDCERLDPWLRICPPPPSGLCFEREDFRDAARKAIHAFGPDVILLDPWNAAARDDKQRDYLDTFELIRSTLPSGDAAPALGIVAHTRKPKTDERATGRALLNLLAGSYVLGSVPRCVFVLQSASDDPQERRVVWTCAKNNDGELGPRSAWERQNGLFDPVTDFDWDEFDNPNKDERARVTEADMDAVFDGGRRQLRKAEAAAALEEQSGVKRSAAYNALKLNGKFGSRLTEMNGLLSWK